jgi:hypothetical protein
MQLTEIQLKNFWSKVNKTDTCWLWTAALTKSGYGMVKINYISYYAHRISYELTHGEIPTGLDLDHKCRIRNCLNPSPEHLEPVTRRENVLRGEGIASLNWKKTFCHRGHPFNVENTHYYKNKFGATARHCLICRKINNQQRNQEKIAS